MGFFDSWSDLVAAASPWTPVEAEAVESAPEQEVCGLLFSQLCLMMFLRESGGEVGGCEWRVKGVLWLEGEVSWASHILRHLLKAGGGQWMCFYCLRLLCGARFETNWLLIGVCGGREEG